jgi:hypothetical protein
VPEVGCARLTHQDGLRGILNPTGDLMRQMCEYLMEGHSTMPNDFVSVIQPTASDPDRKRGARALPVLPVRDTVLFPHAVLPLTVGRDSSIQLIQSLGEEKTILVVAQRDARQDLPEASELYQVGTLATIHKVVKMPNQSLFVFTEGTERVRLSHFEQSTPFLTAEYETISDPEPEKTPEMEALQRNVVFAHTERRPADHCPEHRRAEPSGGLHRFVAAVFDDYGQAGAAGDHRCRRAS